LKYKAYIFDYDYTLVFSEPGILMCFRHTFESFGYPGILDEDIVRTIGMPLKDALSQLTGVEDETELENMRACFHDKADEVMNANTELYPDTVPTLDEIRRRGGLIGIVSNKLRRRIADMLEMRGLMHYADVIIGPEDISIGKPNPEGLLMAIERLTVKKDATLYIGDSIIDGETARNAGVDFVGVTTGTTTEEDFAKEPSIKIIQNLSELFD
jgi:phosphoglycolate phosphatase